LIPTLFIIVAIFAFMLMAMRQPGHIGAGDGESLAGIYTRFQGRVYMNIPFQGYYLVPGADAASFGPLGGWDSSNLGKDSHAVYCGSQAIAGLHPQQVRLVKNSYVSDGTHAWYCSDEKDNATYHWWQDLLRKGDEDSPEKPRRRDYMLVPLQSVNAMDLKSVGGAYAQDGTRAYHEGTVIPQANGPALHIVELGWGEMKDGREADYARDDRRVYFQGMPVPDAAPATFFAWEPDGAQWHNLYGVDTATGQFYIGAKPFPRQVDGQDSSGLRLLSANREKANHEIFYNAAGIWYWDYQDDALKRGCDAPFPVADRSSPTPPAPRQLAPGVWTDGRNAFVLRAIEHWRHGRSDRSLEARITQLLMLPGLDQGQWRKVEDLTVGSQERGTLWQAAGTLYFAPDVGQGHFMNDALYVVRDLDRLKRDMVANDYYLKLSKAKDIEPLDSANSKVVCEMRSGYPALWQFWK